MLSNDQQCARVNLIAQFRILNASDIPSPPLYFSILIFFSDCDVKRFGQFSHSPATKRAALLHIDNRARATVCFAFTEDAASYLSQPLFLFRE